MGPLGEIGDQAITAVRIPHHSPQVAARYLPKNEQMEMAPAPHTTATMEAARPR
jgi:hypothetical protein